MTATSSAPSKRRTWIPIVIAAVVVIAVVGIGLIASAVVFFYKHVNTTVVAEQTANTEIQRARARFAGQQPLIEVESGDEMLVHRTPDAPRRPIAAVHVLGYDADEGKLISVDIPGWLLRVVPSLSGIRVFENREVTHGSTRLTLEDLERHGPGLIVDAHQRDGEVLVWTE